MSRHRFILLAGDEENVRRQDYFVCIQNIAANPAGESIVWEYYRENWTNLTERFGLNDRSLGRLISSITKNFASSVKLEEIEQFYVKYPVAGAGTSARKQAIETVKYNIIWLEKNKAQLDDWLQSENYKY